MAPSATPPLLPVRHIPEARRAHRAGIEGWQIWDMNADGELVRARAAPWKVSEAAYARAVRAMNQIAKRRGTAGLGVDEDHDARLWRAWNEAALRQCRILIARKQKAADRA